MDRQFVAYLLIAGLMIALAVGVVRSRYYSHSQVLRRSRRADEARWAERARLRDASPPED